jgi:N-methylhydantoinase B
VLIAEEENSMPIPAHVAASLCDPVQLEIINGGMRAALEEMGVLLERTSMSASIREKKDYFVALYDPKGCMVAGTVVPLFGKVLEPILEHYPLDSMRRGDIYWYSDCYASQGAVTHSPDQIFIAPVFAKEGLCGFVQSWAHLTDIGGMHPGSISSEATSIYQEGMIVPPLRLYREGVPNSEVLRFFERNTRYPATTRGDMRSLAAALRLGERRFVELVERFSRGVVLDAFRQFQDRTAARVRSLFLEAIRPGRYSFEDFVESDGHSGPFGVRLDMEVGPNAIMVDTTRTDDQAVGPINYIMHPVVPSLVLGIYLTSRDGHLELLNDGMMRLVDEVRIRPGSLLQPNFPAPVGMRSLTWLRLQSAFMGLINIATQGRGIASSPAYTVYMLRGELTGAPFLFVDGVAVGYGARAFSDGMDAVYFVAQENYPIEFINSSYPLRMRRYAIHADSGGPGRWRGGCGVTRELEVLTEMTLSLRIDSTKQTPWGVAGGMNGRRGRATVNPGRADQKFLPALSDGTVLKRGDILRIETGGGGGHGHPFSRPPSAVRDDVRRGYVSVRAAREDYGVILGTADEGYPLIEAEIEALRAGRTDSSPRTLIGEVS